MKPDLLSNIAKEKYNTLSNSQKKVINYLLEEPQSAAFNTALQIGNEVNVSESTVIRLSYALGLDGFSDLQKVIRNQLLNSNSTVYKFQTSAALISSESNIFTKVLLEDLEIINNLMNELDEEVLWDVVDALVKADRVVVVGYKISYGAAHWLMLMLNFMIGNVNLHPSTRDSVEEVMNLTENSVVVAISFPRYTKETIQFMENTKEKGALVIAITDKDLSPAGRIAHKTLLTKTNSLSGMDSSAPITVLLNLIVTGISIKHQDSIKNRLKQLEEAYEKYQPFEDY